MKLKIAASLVALSCAFAALVSAKDVDHKSPDGRFAIRVIYPITIVSHGREVFRFTPFFPIGKDTIYTECEWSSDSRKVITVENQGNAAVYEIAVLNGNTWRSSEPSRVDRVAMAAILKAIRRDMGNNPLSVSIRLKPKIGDVVPLDVHETFSGDREAAFTQKVSLAEVR